MRGRSRKKKVKKKKAKMSEHCRNSGARSPVKEGRFAPTGLAAEDPWPLDRLLGPSGENGPGHTVPAPSPSLCPLLGPLAALPELVFLSRSLTSSAAPRWAKSPD